MKKLLVMVVVIMMFTSSLVVNAAADPTKSSTSNKVNAHLQAQVKKQEHVDSFIKLLAQKQDERIEKSTVKWSEQQAKRDINSAKFLELVTTYTPEMIEEFELALSAHTSVHEELFTERSAIYSAFVTETNALLTTLKADVDVKLNTGEITAKEARAILKAFVAERKAAFTTLLETYKTAIDVEKTAQEVRSEEVKTIRLTLKEAIKTEDTETIVTSIESLYTYLLEHIEFDQFKLTTLKDIF